MTVGDFPLPHEFLARAATRIINEVRGTNRIIYGITSKTPTNEWELFSAVKNSMD
jgi:GMP synthase (glutamine-hydrolysing)